MANNKESIEHNEEEASARAPAPAATTMRRRHARDRRSMHERLIRPLPRSHRPGDVQPQPQQQQRQQLLLLQPSPIHARRASLRQRRIARRPELSRKLNHMSVVLSPLVQVTTGLVHPAFPRSMLQFWLLTDAQLEDMARFYHQRAASPMMAAAAAMGQDRTWHRLSFSYLRTQYPCPITWGSDLTLEDKRRKIGKFIGLRGCETPRWLMTEEEIADGARRARLADDEEIWRRKMHPGRF